MKSTIEITVEEYEALKAAAAKVVALQEQLDWFKRQLFGRKSERVIDSSEESPLLTGFELPDADEEVPETMTVPAHDRRKKRKSNGNCTLTFSEDVPIVENLIDVPKEERTLPDGREMVLIDVDVEDKLCQRPDAYYIQRNIRPRYALRGNARLGVVQEPAPACIIKGSKFHPSFMAGLVTEKMCFHMPLNRLQEKLSFHGVTVTRQTLSVLFITLGQRILPLFSLMRDLTLAQKCIFTDDTPVKLIEKGRGKTIEARIWTYVGGQSNAPPYHIYEFTRDRRHKHPLERLKNFSGFFHADAYGAYETLDAQRADISWGACWSHARRKYETMPSGENTFCLLIMRKMRYLFLFERVAWKCDAQERLRIRQKHEKPIVDEIFNLLKDKVKQRAVLPASNFAKAMGYMLTREKNFRNYLTNADARMENNTAERALRKLVLGRKAWLFVGSEDGGESTAALLSLVQTCRVLKINPQEYLEDLFSRPLPTDPDELAALLPDRWQAARDQQAAERVELEVAQ